MSDIICAAAIAVSGALIVSFITAIIQWKITKKISDNARKTTVFQVQASKRLELENRRKETIVDLISNFVSMIDPSAHQPFNRQYKRGQRPFLQIPQQYSPQLLTKFLLSPNL